MEGDDVSNLLIPFVARECGCTNGDAIRQLYLPASLGHISSREFWARIRCTYPASEREYLDTQLTLDPDFVAVAERLKKRLETAAQLGMHTVCRLRNDRNPPTYERAIESLSDLLTLL